MARAAYIGRVLPLTHPGCGPGCRELCFELRDPQGRVIRLTHGAWLDVLAKLNRAQMANQLGGVRSAITAPQVIQADPTDDGALLYYWHPAGGNLLAVAVKCPPRRFQDGRGQRRYRL